MTEPNHPPDDSLEPTDQSLLVRLRSGCADAATLLYSRYSRRLRELASAQCSRQLSRLVEVDDIVQSVFGSFFRGASQGFYDLPEGEELWRLFLVIALNKIRARARYHHAACRDARKTAGAEIYTFTLENVAARSDDAERLLALVVEDALEQLPEAQRAVIRLRIEGHDVTEISRRIGRSQRSTERLLQEARQKLAVLLSESEPSPPS